MEQMARVLEVKGDQVKILVQRKTACGHDCSKCGGCGGAENRPLVGYARNDAGAQAGDMVEIFSEEGTVAKRALIAYLLPLVVFFLAYLIPNLLGASAGVSGVIGVVGFCLSIWGIMCYDRHMQRNKAMPVVRRVLHGETEE